MMTKEIDLLQSVDAKEWAEEFVKTKKSKRWTIEDIDESLMVAWFAAAMMAVHDKLRRLNDD